MVYLEWISRAISPPDLRIGLLILLVGFFVLHVFNPAWILTNQVLATLPVQRFKWKSETLLSSTPNRVASVLTSILAISLLLHAHFSEEAQVGGGSILELAGLIALLFFIKYLGIRLFFYLHDHAALGNQLIDFQYGFNQLITACLTIYLCLDLFAFHQTLPFGELVIIILLLLYFVRSVGIIILLVNQFRYPSIALFIYLCAFEIGPLLVLAKVLLLS